MPKLKLIDVEIDRGRDVVTVAVPAHEVRVLQAIHGPEKVRPAAVQEGDTAVFDDSAHAEYDRMTRKYHRINAPDPVRAAYPMGPEQMTDHGFTSGGPSKPAPSGLIKKHKPAPEPEAPKEAPKDKPAKQDK